MIDEDDTNIEEKRGIKGMLIVESRNSNGKKMISDKKEALTHAKVRSHVKTKYVSSQKIQ